MPITFPDVPNFRFQHSTKTKSPVVPNKMKAAFGSKRKARKIQVDEDDERGGNDAGASAEAVNTCKWHSNGTAKPC